MSTATTLNLDARQRAMLDEMGVKVWWPTASAALTVVTEPGAAAAADAEAALPPQPLSPSPVQAPARKAADGGVASPLRARPAPPAIAAPAPAPGPATAGARGAAVLVDPPQRIYNDSANDAVEGGWLVVVDMPPEADGRHGEVFAGEAGQLLDAMLQALRLHVGTSPVHLMRTHRGVASGQPGSPRAMSDSWIDHARPLAPRVVLAMGPLAAQSLLQSGDPLGRLRGRVAPLAAIGDVPVVATYHPAYLLRNPADKARAWADLCLAAEQIDPAPR